VCVFFLFCVWGGGGWEGETQRSWFRLNDLLNSPPLSLCVLIYVWSPFLSLFFPSEPCFFPAGGRWRVRRRRQVSCYVLQRRHFLFLFLFLLFIIYDSSTLCSASTCPKFHYISISFFFFSCHALQRRHMYQMESALMQQLR
jgi:hypothetical protein